MSDPTEQTSATDDAPRDPASPVVTVEQPPSDTVGAAASDAAAKRDWLALLGKIASFAVALFLFVLAIQLMKEGAKALAPTARGQPAVLATGSRPLAPAGSAHTSSCPARPSRPWR